MTTKDRILDTATALFNEATTGEVSTNHIAKAVGISPGNLYYHYTNKEEIIRAVLERMFEAFGKVWVLPHDRKVTLADVQNTISQLFEVLWHFRFFYREQLALMRRDPKLAVRHQQMQEQRIGEQERFFLRFVEDGVFKEPEDPSNFRAIITGCWVIANNWLSFVETSGEVVETVQLERGVDLILQIMEPYLAETPSAAQATRKGEHHGQAHITPASTKNQSENVS